MHARMGIARAAFWFDGLLCETGRMRERRNHRQAEK
jgi:hypothetical protein